MNDGEVELPLGGGLWVKEWGKKPEGFILALERYSYSPERGKKVALEIRRD